MPTPGEPTPIGMIDAINRDYPRLSIPPPGPNVGGPCLYKDGYFLLERVPFPELISTAFKINEGMTAQIALKIETPAVRPESGRSSA